MGLTNKSVGKNVLDKDLEIDKANQTVIAIAGNPNVGKSTIFNALTGLNQHTGNWAGKTVSNAQGVCKYKDKNYILVDIPGTYSLLAHSKEEEIARNFICFGNADITLIVCDGTCLERNLNLVLQAMEISPKVFICINLMDEAERKGIEIDTEKLSQLLNVPVIKTQADKPETFRNLMEEIANYSTVKKENIFSIPYPLAIEEAIKPVLKSLLPFTKNTNINNRWLSLRFLDNDIDLIKETSNYINYDLLNNKEIQNGIKNGIEILEQNGINNNTLKDKIVSTIIQQGENINQQIVNLKTSKYSQIDRKIDKIITGKILGYPLMFLTLALIFWITIVGANYPSKILSNLFFYIEEQLILFATFIGVTPWISNMVFSGMFRVLGWVVAVMLPPMAIFFPLFTLLEDLGYLPRVAFNLDKHFQRCCACGKQALTMCMGFGCNAAGIVGCRIIDSPRERLIAIITNNFVPCNGRFPTLITIITMFFVGTGRFSTLTSAMLLALLILFGILMTFFVSFILSKTILKGVPTSFTLELPPYRKPQIIKVIIRSIFDRTAFVLGRAVVVAIPAGLIIWIMANFNINGVSLLKISTNFLQPFGNLIGLDGVILMAFILGFPANEIVMPIAIMAYMSTGTLTEFNNITDLRILLVNNGWTWITAINTMIFSLMHWPCSTTCLTIKKETQSLKWTMISFFVPTIVGIFTCFIFTSIASLFI